jgi:hypothetical protein
MMWGDLEISLGREWERSERREEREGKEGKGGREGREGPRKKSGIQ